MLAWCRGPLGARPWFSRVWVLQECALGRSVVFACGRERVDFARFWAVAFFLSLFAAWSGLHNASGDSAVDARSRARLEAVSSFLPTSTIGLRRIHASRPDDARLNLKSLLCRTNVLRSDRHRGQATKPVDRVYALLGIANDAAAARVVPDYVAPCADAYTQTAQVLLQAGHLDVLGLCRKRRIEGAAALPSWVPDWHAENCQPWMLYREDALFDACGASPAQLSFEEAAGRPVLAVCGVALGGVADAGQVWSIGLEGDITDHLPELCKLFTDVADFAARSERYSREQKLELVWRVPVCDLMQDGATNWPRRAAAEARLGHWALYTLASGNPDWYHAHPEARVPNISYIGRLRRMLDSRPCLLQTGYVGICPMEAQAGRCPGCVPRRARPVRPEADGRRVETGRRGLRIRRHGRRGHGGRSRGDIPRRVARPAASWSSQDTR